MTAPEPPRCPNCGALRVVAPDCPQCGVIYAKAEARAIRVQEAVGPQPLDPTLRPEAVPLDQWSQLSEDDARLERRLRAGAIPAALLLAWLLVSTSMGHALLRIFISMWIHELGHAVTAWLCGFAAFPGPWFTSVSPGRSVLLPLCFAAALGYWVYSSYRAQRWVAAALGVSLLALLGIGTLLLSVDRAQMLITFGGDAGCLVLGTALMATVYAPHGSRLHSGWLRWGFLFIGAFSFVDVSELWWAARSNDDRIPFGQNEGVGLSDPSKLTEQYGWTVSQLVGRYVWLSAICLTVLAALYCWGLRRIAPATGATPPQGR